MGTDGAAVAGGPRGDSHEDPKERVTRKWNEMLQELRVAQTGVQVLTGFLLTVPFSARFGDLDRFDKVVYLVVVASSILAAGLLIAPVAFHRVLFGRSEKAWLVGAANRSARAGLALLAITMTGAMLLVFSVVVDRTAAFVAGGVTFVVLAGLWLVVPLFGGEGDTPAESSRPAP